MPTPRARLPSLYPSFTPEFLVSIQTAWSKSHLSSQFCDVKTRTSLKGRGKCARWHPRLFREVGLHCPTPQSTDVLLVRCVTEASNVSSSSPVCPLPHVELVVNSEQTTDAIESRSYASALLRFIAIGVGHAVIESQCDELARAIRLGLLCGPMLSLANAEPQRKAHSVPLFEAIVDPRTGVPITGWLIHEATSRQPTTQARRKHRRGPVTALLRAQFTRTRHNTFQHVFYSQFINHRRYYASLRSSNVEVMRSEVSHGAVPFHVVDNVTGWIVQRVWPQSGVDVMELAEDESFLLNQKMNEGVEQGSDAWNSLRTSGGVLACPGSSPLGHELLVDLKKLFTLEAMMLMALAIARRGFKCSLQQRQEVLDLLCGTVGRGADVVAMQCVVGICALLDASSSAPSHQMGKKSNVNVSARKQADSAAQMLFDMVDDDPPRSPHLHPHQLPEQTEIPSRDLWGHSVLTAWTVRAAEASVDATTQMIFREVTRDVSDVAPRRDASLHCSVEARFDEIIISLVYDDDLLYGNAVALWGELGVLFEVIRIDRYSWGGAAGDAQWIHWIDDPCAALRSKRIRRLSMIQRCADRLTLTMAQLQSDLRNVSDFPRESRVVPSGWTQGEPAQLRGSMAQLSFDEMNPIEEKLFANRLQTMRFSFASGHDNNSQWVPSFSDEEAVSGKTPKSKPLAPFLRSFRLFAAGVASDDGARAYLALQSSTRMLSALDLLLDSHRQNAELVSLRRSVERARASFLWSSFRSFGFLKESLLRGRGEEVEDDNADDEEAGGGSSMVGGNQLVLHRLCLQSAPYACGTLDSCVADAVRLILLTVRMSRGVSVSAEEIQWKKFVGSLPLGCSFLAGSSVEFIDYVATDDTQYEAKDHTNSKGTASLLVTLRSQRKAFFSEGSDAGGSETNNGRRCSLDTARRLNEIFVTPKSSGDIVDAMFESFSPPLSRRAGPNGNIIGTLAMHLALVVRNGRVVAVSRTRQGVLTKAAAEVTKVAASRHQTQ